jgi:hypothetical protein
MLRLEPTATTCWCRSWWAYSPVVAAALPGRRRTTRYPACSRPARSCGSLPRACTSWAVHAASGAYLWAEARGGVDGTSSAQGTPTVLLHVSYSGCTHRSPRACSHRRAPRVESVSSACSRSTPEARSVTGTLVRLRSQSTWARAVSLPTTRSVRADQARRPHQPTRQARRR